MAMTDALARRMTSLAVSNIGREYPNAPGHLLRSAADLRSPRELHPAFFGSWDWHSSVHQHWLLVRQLRLGLDGQGAGAARTAMRKTLTAEHLAVEAAYLRDRPSFERTYGWAWLLALADEVDALPATDPDAGAWRDALAPAVEVVRVHWMDFIPRAGYPIRAGTHANTAFGLIAALDHARRTADRGLERAIATRATEWFGGDADYPAHLEPGGDDFLSGALTEAALMATLLDARAFARWLTGFLPDLADGRPPSLFTPPVVADRSDPKTLHLDGLSLSRAWCLARIAAAIPGDARAAICLSGAAALLEAGLPRLFSGEYGADHWLSTFALLALTDGPALD